MFRLSRISLAELDAAFQRARRELREVGLLDDGRYLDRIDCVQALLPTFSSELGYVYDEGVGGLAGFVGFRPGVIYVPFSSMHRRGLTCPAGRCSTPSATSTRTPGRGSILPFVRGRWFRQTFGATYHGAWASPPSFDRDHFVSEYACTAPKEDFAETFMTALRYRRSLDRFASRPGLRRKVLAVRRAITIAAKERAPTVRGPRTR
ncbi:MAG: hypothetical protein IT374_06380 [Polyangiaceae bacterium]|nr:hypothetical protein [Polyangiaceae bacterium]